MLSSIFIILVCSILSAIGYCVVLNIIPRITDWFVRSLALSGKDLAKIEKPVIPESAGVITLCIFFFISTILALGKYWIHTDQTPFFPQDWILFLSALLPILLMGLLGFFDDRYELKWRTKILFSALVSILTLATYYFKYDIDTVILIPKPLGNILGSYIDLHVFYFGYMAMLAVFCTNAINIYAGINGIEVGQVLVISGSVIVFNIIECNGENWSNHLFSLQLMIPFFFTSLALYHFNCYPAIVFVGDTFCYYAGMTLAVVAILAQFSQTLFIFFIPQTLNFILSLPQLFRMLPKAQVTKFERTVWPNGSKYFGF